jgi:3-deoxy-D-arabino-heptulosonate 7-phosphate (DAHP) synthase
MKNLKLASRETSERTIISHRRSEIGTGLLLIAGPCSVESEEQMFETLRPSNLRGANMLRGGAFKPRTSP